ncbi:Metal resistance protein YCF1 [Ceratobasidium theobromae]|uniref:Metal resistance protein YCF1 n=1 Tax=Ceratobasidium theobromae TaxID=1582974 RepID=A0A5N5QGT3_9AGAM|nr:Metal resistance protein YCF1 [Ceratobasidium theobromae]
MSSQRSNAAAGHTLINQVSDIQKELDALKLTADLLAKDYHGLRDRVDTLEDEKVNNEKLIGQMTANLDAQKHHIDYLYSLLVLSNSAPHAKLPLDLLNDDANANLVDPNLASDDMDEITLTIDEDKIQQDQTLKRVIYKSLCQMYGVPHLHDLHYMVFPPVDEGHPDWPSTMNENGERCPYMRLDFGRPIDEPRNWARLTAWADYAMNHGASIVPEATELLSKLSIEQIQIACRLRFWYLRKDFKKKLKVAAAAPVAAVETDIPIDPTLQQLDAAPNPPVSPPPYPETPNPELRSRARGKCNICTAKREKLSGEMAKFQDPKYDSYFCPGPMSDDEDKYNLVDGTWVKVPNLYESREFEFISNEMRQCRDAVDSIPNPREKSRPTPCVRGPPKPGPPRKATTEPWALRAWMVDPTFLATNTWLEGGLVLSNGVAWGDQSEPTLHKSKYRMNKRRRVGLNQAGPSSALIEQARQARRAMEEAQRRAQELQEQPGRATTVSETND